jgi:hypothetical protein
MSNEAIAAELAEAVRKANGRTWRKVTTLLDLFRVYRLTPAVRDRMAVALDRVGLDVSPSLRDVRRYQTVRLTLREVSLPQTGSEAQYLPRGTLTKVTTWRRGMRPRPLAEGDTLGEDEILWIETNADADPTALLSELRRLCGPEVSPEMVEDLLSSDPYPRVTCWDTALDIRAVSTVRVSAVETDDEGTPSLAGSLEFHPVEFLAGQRWLVTCWQRRLTYTGATESADGDSPPAIETFATVERRWLDEDGATAGDLATFALYEMSCGYTDVRRLLHAWFESWELHFYGAAGNRRPSEVDVQTLVELRSLVAQFAKRVRASQLPRAQQSRSWFGHVTQRKRAADVGEQYERALSDLDRLNEMVRSGFDLVQSFTAGYQLQLAEEQNRTAQRLQQKIEVITSVLLVPTLIAGVFGANTELPGKESWTGFLLMCLLLVLGGASAYGVLRGLRARDERQAL